MTSGRKRTLNKFGVKSHLYVFLMSWIFCVSLTVQMYASIHLAKHVVGVFPCKHCTVEVTVGCQVGMWIMGLFYVFLFFSVW